MTTIEEWAKKAQALKAKGLTDMEIAEELHLSPETIEWLLTKRETEEKPPADVKIGWRSVGVMGGRIELLSALMVDVVEEEMKKRNIDVEIVVGLAMNGIPLATMISAMMEKELTIYRPIKKGNGQSGNFMSNYASVEGKTALLVDDVIGTGRTMTSAIKSLREAGGRPGLVMVIVNKTPYNEIEGVPLRALIRARAVAGHP